MLVNGQIRSSVTKTGGSSDEVVGIYSPGRWGLFDGGYKRVAWEGKFADYVKHDGVLVPTRGEVGWHTHGEWRSVWRGTVTQAVLE